MTDEQIALQIKAIREHTKYVQAQPLWWVKQYCKALVGEADFPPDPDTKPKTIFQICNEHEATIKSQQETIEKLKGALNDIVKWWNDETDDANCFDKAEDLLQSLNK